MNFFERQNQARRKTQLLLFYFLPAVALIILAVYAVIAISVGPKGYQLFLSHNLRLHPVLFPYVAGSTFVLILCGSLYKMNQLSQGGCMVAALLGGKWVNPASMDPDEKRLRDVVEEMSIASGVPVPEIFILPGEEGINSFVVGSSSGNVAIVVTRGALKLLTRDELQGVIAHEFSHILNGDTFLNLWLIGLLHGILCIALVGKSILRAGFADDGSNRKRGLPIPLIVVSCLLMAVGSIGYFLSRLIKCAVCRQREELADAAAVQFTRNPQSLAGALKKIGGLIYGSRLRAVNSELVSHICFAGVGRNPWLGFMRTHPPLEKRIRLLDPAFDGTYPHVKSCAARAIPTQIITGQPQTIVLDRPLDLGLLFAKNAPAPRHLEYAAVLRATFSEEINAAAHEPFGACALVFAMLLSTDQKARELQLVETAADPGLLHQAEKYFPATSTMTNGQKLALINLAFPALREMSCVQFDRFCKTVQCLCESDRQISMFEYTLQSILKRHLNSFYKGSRAGIVHYYVVNGLMPECAVILSALAWHGTDSAEQAETAFNAGAEQLNQASIRISLLAYESCNLPQIDAALNKLNTAALPVKKTILKACASVVAHDGLVQEPEAALLRAMAESLDCPLPPFVNV